MENSRASLVSRASETGARAKGTLLNTIATEPNPSGSVLAFRDFVAAVDHENYSQFCQDLFVAYIYQGERDGGYLEFGAADGITHSNTLLFASRFDWHGILVEPQIEQFQLLQANRRESLVVRAAFRTDDRRSVQLACLGQLTSIVGYHDRDFHKDKRVAAAGSGWLQQTPTLDLSSLCAAYFSQSHPMAYMSVDVEGAELPILSSFDFRIRPGVMTIEHNSRSDDEAALDALMATKGYQRVFRNYRRLCGPDAWYVRDDLFVSRFRGEQ